MGVDLKPEELARLRMKAKRGTLAPEEQVLLMNYMEEQSSAPPQEKPGDKAEKPKKPLDWQRLSYIGQKVLGVALLAFALLVFGPPIAKQGIVVAGKVVGLVKDTYNMTESATNAVDDYAKAEQTNTAHYVWTDHEAGTVDYERKDVFLSGEYYIAIFSNAHRGISRVECGANQGTYKDGGLRLDMRGELFDGNFQEFCNANGLDCSTLFSADNAFNYNESELEGLVKTIVPVITYGTVEQYGTESEWSDSYIEYSKVSNYQLDMSIDGSGMFADATPTSNPDKGSSSGKTIENLGETVLLPSVSRQVLYAN